MSDFSQDAGFVGGTNRIFASNRRVQDKLRNSLISQGVQIDDEDMHEDLTTRISNVLRQYSVEQAPNEFLANAADAGADIFNLLLDSKHFPCRQILNEKMSDFQSGPALIIHNNGVFTEVDFKGIRRTGLGGKQSREDTIGRFGLGSLAMFHFTELPMIVSGSYVLFLDPARKYLPPTSHAGRSALRLPISTMRLNYPDHLKTVQGLFGFKMEHDYYSGTLFRLALRTTSQASSSNLSRQAISLQDVTRLLAQYSASAAHSLLNIGVAATTYSVRAENDEEIRQQWSVRADLSVSEKIDDVQTETVTLLSNVQGSRRETWFAVTRKVELPADFVALRTQHKLRQVFLKITGLVPSSPTSQDNPQRRLYSRLPLPTFTSLPVHIDASFILADDRRSIRFEESGHMNLETRYNHWLLSQQIPQLYAFLLQAWPTEMNSYVWPGVVSRSQSDPVSRTVTDGFYEQLASSTRRFCITMAGTRVAPSTAHFLGTEPASVKSIMTVLKPPTFVRLPAHVRSHLPADVRMVDAAAIHDAILSQLSSFKVLFDKKTITIAQIDELLIRMMNDQKQSVIGLDILPLADGSLGPIGCASGRVIYSGGWERSAQPFQLFSSSCFLHTDITRSRSTLVDLEQNIETFGEEQAISFIRQIIPQAQEIALGADAQSWLALFWKQLPSLRLDFRNSPDFKSFAVVPTGVKSTYVSLEYCDSPQVLCSPSQGDRFLEPILKSLGAILVPRNSCAESLRNLHLHNLSCTFETVLQFLEHIGLPSNFAKKIGNASLASFATYVKDNLPTLRVAEPQPAINYGRRKQRLLYVPTYVVHHQNIARQLPIWLARSRGRETFVAASHESLKMLPSTIPFEAAAPFLKPSGTYIGFDSSLQTILAVQPITLAVLCDSFDFPETMMSQQIPTYERLLDALISSGLTHQVQTVTLKIPNVQGHMVQSNTLYAHCVDLFRVAFASRPSYFIHPKLRNIEHHLRAFGLNTSVTLTAFEECARVVDQDKHREGAAAAYQFYSEELWRLIPAGQNSVVTWRSLDTLCFIPRSRSRRNYANRLDTSFSEWAETMPDIVSPSQILRPEHEAIAWTQRALFTTAPSQNLLVAYPSLGVPAGFEVVEHLRKLAMIADRYNNNSNLISDFAATYQWLDTHVADCEEYLIEYQDERLFLNVNNPSITWTFASATELVFNGRDDSLRKRVRNYLLPYRRLLLAVGAREIIDVVRPELELSSADEGPVSLRSKFDRYRQQRYLTDVVIKSSDGEEFHAHKLMLSDATETFERRFSGRWANDAQVSLSDVSGATIRHVLDFIYARKLPFSDVLDVDLPGHLPDLLPLLHFVHEWDISVLFIVVENRLIGAISLGTYKELEQQATTYNATALLGKCVEYRTINQLE